MSEAQEAAIRSIVKAYSSWANAVIDKDLLNALLQERDSLKTALEEAKRDARRYRRLRILGVATGIESYHHDARHLKNGTVMCFTNLDAHVDADIAANPSRGEAR